MPSEADWEELRNKYPSKAEFENRTLFGSMPERQAMYGLLAWLNNKKVIFAHKLNHNEILKFSWNGKLAIIYQRGKHLGGGNPPAHEAVEAFLNALVQTQKDREAMKQKKILSYDDTMMLFVTKEHILVGMDACAEWVTTKEGYPNVYTSVRDYLMRKLSTAQIMFKHHPIDLYHEWLQRYHTRQLLGAQL